MYTKEQIETALKEREIGYSRASIYTWYRKYQKSGVVGLMSSKKQIKKESLKKTEIVMGIGVFMEN